MFDKIDKLRYLIFLTLNYIINHFIEKTKPTFYNIWNIEPLHGFYYNGSNLATYSAVANGKC